MSTVPKLPVPTGDALMVVVADGPSVCARWRETILSWDPRHAVPQIVMNALDPALLELILGPGDKNSLMRLLRAHYEDVRERFPGPFADVEQVWRIQRAWWMQFVEADDVEASAAALAETYATLDVLVPHPAGALWLCGQRPAGRTAPRRPFAVVMPALRRPFAVTMPALRLSRRRRRRSRLHTRRYGRAEHRVQTHAISPPLARRLEAAEERTGQSLATIADGALRVGLAGFVAACSSTPSTGRPNRGVRISIRVSADLYDRITAATRNTGRSTSVVVAGAIQAGLARWLRRTRSSSPVTPSHGPRGASP